MQVKVSAGGVCLKDSCVNDTDCKKIKVIFLLRVLK